MKYKAYPKYKNSGVKWIGKIPEKWNIEKLKNLIDTLESGKRKDFEDTTYALSIGGEHLNWDGTLNLKNKRYLSKDYYLSLNNGKIRNNDILLVKDGATIGKTVFIDKLNKKMVINEHVFLIRNNAKIESKLLYYLICSTLGFSQIKLKETGSAQGGINKNIKDDIIFPLIENKKLQLQVIDFLDYKIGNISLSIEKNKKLIELLKTKKISLINEIITKGLESNIKLVDSGIENIGEIPEHWKVKKLKEITEIKPSNVDKKSKKNEPEVLLCNYTDVYNNDFITNNIKFMKATASYEQIKKLSLKKGDIVITKDSETAEDIAVPTLVNEPLNNLVCGYHLALIRPLKVDSNYLFRSFECKKINDQFMLGANGVTRFGLGTYPIKNAYICYPPLEEQKEIGEYINKEVSKIDKTIEKIEIKIKLLDEYKESLIYHVVTGKIDVSGEKI